MIALSAPAKAEPETDRSRPGGSEGADRTRAVSIPPPVSGRRLDQPSSIRPADVLARVNLLRAHLETIRAYMGRPPPPPPLLRVEDAEPREVYVQFLNLNRRVQQLGFEQMRSSMERVESTDAIPQPHHMLALANVSLKRILQLQVYLGTEARIAETAEVSSTTSSEVYNAVIEVGELVHALLDKKTTSSTVFSGSIFAVQVARILHARAAGRFLPEPTAFEPRKTSGDVYKVLRRCLGLTKTLAELNGEKMLRVELRENVRTVTPDDVLEVLAVLIAELDFIHSKMVGEEPNVDFIAFQRKFPSHNYQKARDLEAILTSLVKRLQRR